ncbi:MAG: peptidase M64 N-terminal domain-containing protein, partial [Bacteroidota bacterium]
MKYRELYKRIMNFKQLLFLLLITLFPISFAACQQSGFRQYFSDSTLRIDYYHTGNASNEIFSVDKMYVLPGWSTNPRKLIPDFDYGSFRYTVKNKANNEILFISNYDCIFKEYQTTQPAIDGLNKTFHETALVPFPKEEIIFCIEKRDSLHQFHEIFSLSVDPKD